MVSEVDRFYRHFGQLTEIIYCNKRHETRASVDRESIFTHWASNKRHQVTVIISKEIFRFINKSPIYEILKFYFDHFHRSAKFFVQIGWIGKFVGIIKNNFLYI